MVAAAAVSATVGIVLGRLVLPFGGTAAVAILAVASAALAGGAKRASP